MSFNNESYQKINTIITDFSALTQEYQKQKNVACDNFESAFSDFVNDFFKLVPSVKQVSWAQYTPYFNDGDVCRFRVRDPILTNYTDDEKFDDKFWEMESWQLKNYAQFGITLEEKEIINLLLTLIENNSEFLESIYGDHARIILSSNGIKIEEYNHD